MKYRFFTTSEKAWKAMLSSIQEARHSIFWEVHSFRNNTPEFDFFDTLKQKAKEGVKVKLIIDGIGSFWLSNKSRKELEDAGAEIILFKNWIHRIHKKVLIVDEEVAFLGGVNIANNYRSWIDLQIEIHGAVVRNLLRYFSRSYKLCKGKDPYVLSFYEERKIDKAKFKFRKAKHWVIDHSPVLRKKQMLKGYYQKKISEAKESLSIVTPYFIPHRWLIKSLKSARARGVKIDVIIPQNTDIGLARIANTFFAHLMNKYGIEFYLTSKMIHAKAFLVDNKEGMIGSNNIDAQSFDFNSETSLIFERKDMVQDLKKIIAQWKRQAIPFYEIKRKARWYEKPLGWFVSFLQPLL
jgi:cardiolipin synthase A/B